MVLFNPEQDLCIANGDPNFVPPASAVEFREQCKWIEKYMVPVPGENITPWGWNYSLRASLLKDGVQQNLLPSDEQLDFITKHSRREFAIELHNFIIKKLSSDRFFKNHVSIILPDYRIIATDLELVVGFIKQKGEVVLKAPLSGSGKGLRYVNGEMLQSDLGWVKRVLQKQGTVIVEQKMKILKECAMLFLCSKEGVDFKGFSLFSAVNGAYKANVLASDEYIRSVLGEYISVSVIEDVKELIREFFCDRLFGKYVGYIGVDQMFCEDGYVMASEINLRMTMGHIARNIYDSHREDLNLGEGTHLFNPVSGFIAV